MIGGIILLVLFSVIVIFGVLYVKDSRLDELGKSKILLLVGILLAISLTISAFKQRRYITFSLLKSDINEVQRHFTHMPFQYNNKFKTLAKGSEIPTDEFYTFNYQNYDSPPSSYTDKIIYASSKYQGASRFLYDFAVKLHSKGIPALYCKFEYELDTEVEIAEQLGVPSLRIIEDAVSNWNKKNLYPFIIIDGLEFVVRSQELLKVLDRLLTQHKVNFIGNTENIDTIQPFFRTVRDREIIVKTWQPPNKSFFEKYSTNTYSKNLPRDFKSLASLQKYSEEEASMKRATALREVANFYECGDVLKKIGSQNNARVATIKKSVPITALKKLQSLGLLRVSNGRVELADTSSSSVTDYL